MNTVYLKYLVSSDSISKVACFNFLVRSHYYTDTTSQFMISSCPVCESNPSIINKGILCCLFQHLECWTLFLIVPISHCFPHVPLDADIYYYKVVVGICLCIATLMFLALVIICTCVCVHCRTLTLGKRAQAA